MVELSSQNSRIGLAQEENNILTKQLADLREENK